VRLIANLKVAIPLNYPKNLNHELQNDDAYLKSHQNMKIAIKTTNIKMFQNQISDLFMKTNKRN
jgi:hypothetical protein